MARQIIFRMKKLFHHNFGILKITFAGTQTMNTNDWADLTFACDIQGGGRSIFFSFPNTTSLFLHSTKSFSI